MRVTILTFAVLAAALVVGLWLAFAYQRDMQAVRHRLASGSSALETACGVVEYAEHSEGFPVLVIHGAGGGFDQGLFLGERLIGEGYRIIAPSRFGYLRPVPANHSREDQADAYACLLDALQIDKTVVVAYSAGGLSGLTFAREHPNKTAALILGSAISFTDRDTEADANREANINRVIANDFAYWMLSKFAWRRLGALFGVKREVQNALSDDELNTLRDILQLMWPLSQRLEGVGNDQEQHLPWDYPLDEISTPTLILHAEDDTLVIPDHARHSANNIPGAQLIMAPSGGHFLIGQHDRLRSNVRDWLKQQGLQ